MYRRSLLEDVSPWRLRSVEDRQEDVEKGKGVTERACSLKNHFVEAGHSFGLIRCQNAEIAVLEQDTRRKGKV